MLLGLQESCNKSFEAAANCQPCAYSWLKVCRVASKNWPRTDAWDVGKVDGILDVQIQSIFDLYPIQCFWAVPADLHAFALLSSHVEFGSSRTRMDVWSSRKLWSLPLGRCTCPSWRNSRARCTSAEGSSGCCTVHGESTFCYELLRFYCSRHMHGNFVMQKVIQTLPSNSLGFMIYELKEGMGRNSKRLMGLEGTGWKNVFLHLPARVHQLVPVRRMQWRRHCISMLVACCNVLSNAVGWQQLTWWTFCCSQASVSQCFL